MEQTDKKIPPTPKGILALTDANILEQHQSQIEVVKSGYLAVRKLVSELMTKGTDYGLIPGTKKETLFKAGAEKIGKLLNLSPKYICTNRIVTDNLIMYEYKCELYNQAGSFMGDSEGSCNSKEEKYRWKSTQLNSSQSTDTDFLTKLRAENKLSKKEYGGKTTYFLKEERKDYYDIANTIMKMAEKRAFVAAILVVTGLSEFFTQDLEDFIKQEQSQ